MAAGTGPGRARFPVEPPPAHPGEFRAPGPAVGRRGTTSPPRTPRGVRAGLFGHHDRRSWNGRDEEGTPVLGGGGRGKQWTGSVHQSADGLAWHNHYRLDRTLETVRWEAETVGRLLGTRAAALLCVHGAHVQGGGLHAQGVAIVPAHLLRSALGYDRVLSDADVELLAVTAWTSLRPAA